MIPPCACRPWKRIKNWNLKNLILIILLCSFISQDMTQSLHQQDSSDDGVPMQRSASFHYENTRGGRGLLHPIQHLSQLTSEDDESEDYGSGCDSSQVCYWQFVIDFSNILFLAS